MQRLALAVFAAATVLASVAQAVPAPHFANSDDQALVAQGQSVYLRNCGGCHGRRLQGQALWQLQDQFAGRRAPAHDASGHTWQHSDEDLFQMTKRGRFPEAPRNAKSYMPAFKDGLTDRDILAAIAFIKSTWPTGMRISQSMLNPGFRGMPAHADKFAWTLPPNCTASFQNWAATSK